MISSEIKTVAIYARVSTEEQTENYSIGAQLEKLRSYCEIKGWTIYDEYVDGGFSGGSLDRPEIQRLINHVEQHKFDLVLVYKLDRLSRSQRDTLYLIEDVFHPNNIKFSSVQENFDTSTPLGMAMVGILSVFAQLERAQIKERMALGREARAKEGLWHGGKTPIGYDYDSSSDSVIINEYEALQIKEIFNRFESGESINLIYTYAKNHYTNKYKSYSNVKTIYNILSNKFYIGKIKHKDEYFDGMHQPIIDSKQFYNVQRMLLKNKNKQPETSNFASTTLLGGLLVCGLCGSGFFKFSYYNNNKSVKKNKYKCYARVGHRLAKTSNRCNNITYDVEELENTVIDEIKKLSIEFETNEIKTKEESNQLASLQSKISSIDQQISKLLDLYSIESLPQTIVIDKIKQLEEDRKKVENQIDDYIQQKEKTDLKEVQEQLKSASDIFDNGTFEEKRALIVYLIDKIVLNNDKIEIYWSFQ